MAEILTPDLCIIGAGSSGIAAALAACELGASVVLIERGRMGGARLSTGSVPSKAVVAAGQHAHAIRSGAGFGIAAEQLKVNFRKLHDHVQQVIAALAPVDAAARLEALGIRVLAEEASFSDPRTVAAGETLVRARRFVIATGSRPVVPPIPGLDTVPYFTSQTIFANTRKLTHLVIIGAAATGLELAQAYGRLGTQVTVVEEGTALAGSDPELAEVALRRMQEEGVAIRTGTRVTAIQARSQGIGVLVSSPAGDDSLDASHVMVATGRAASLDGLDLERAGIRRAADDQQRLQLRRNFGTSNRRVYVIGDAAGGAPSAHAAAEQAQSVVRHALLGLPVGRRRPLPTVTYTDPEIAEVGLTEAAARARFKDNFRILRCAFADNDRARALRQTYGVAKLITDRRGRILGAGIVGPGAGELIALFALAIGNGLSASHLESFVAPHPTLSEIATRLGAEFRRGQGPDPLRQRLLALLRLFP